MREPHYVSFVMDRHLLGIDILLVREIIRNVDFTPVAKAPAAVRGLLNLRGQIITVLDLGPALGLPLREIGPDSRCLILKSPEDTAHLLAAGLVDEEPVGEAVGLLVDAISDVIRPGEQGVDPPPANANGIDSDHLRGVVRLEDRLLLVLGLKRLLEEGLGHKGLAARS
jgi:purine-binding chemotaxis protein CheW